jgi:hypothetical protein
MGIDLGKKMFQLFGVDESGSGVVKKKLRRKQLLESFANLPPCWVWKPAAGVTTGRCSREPSATVQRFERVP